MLVIGLWSDMVNDEGHDESGMSIGSKEDFCANSLPLHLGGFLNSI